MLVLFYWVEFTEVKVTQVFRKTTAHLADECDGEAYLAPAPARLWVGRTTGQTAASGARSTASLEV